MELNRTSLPSKMKVLSMATPITGLVTSNTMMMMMTTLTLMVPRWKPMLTYRKLHVSTYCITQYCGNILIYMTRTVCNIYPEDIELEHPHFSNLIQKFIYDQQHPDDSSNSSAASALPTFFGMITIYPSAVATFHAPSDLSGIGGMRRERIRAVKSWRKGPGRYDTIFVNTDPSVEGMKGLNVARVKLFFSFSHDGIDYPCALVHWFSRGAIYQTQTQECGLSNRIFQTISSHWQLSTWILLYERAILFQYSAPIFSRKLFYAQIH